MKRAFLGIELSQELKDKIEKLKEQSQLWQLPIKLVEKENSHIAIKFLDQLNEQQINQINDIIKEALKNFKPFTATIANSLIFPNLHQPRILTLKVISPELEAMAKELISQLEQLPYIIKEQRRYLPHLTLGRIKKQLSIQERNKINNIKFTEQFKVTALQLFASQLTSTGPIYSILKAFNL